MKVLFMDINISMINKKNEIEQHWDQKINDINHLLNDKKWKIWKYIELYWLKNIFNNK